MRGPLDARTPRTADEVEPTHTDLEEEEGGRGAEDRSTDGRKKTRGTEGGGDELETEDHKAEMEHRNMDISSPL